MNENIKLDVRMKDYEFKWKNYFPDENWKIIRLDGKSFHTWTKGFNKPFDENLQEYFKKSCYFLMQEVMNAKLIYTQSDEISIVMTNWKNKDTQQWFNGSLNKILSVSASLLTGYFNTLHNNRLAFFDSRAFTLPTDIEVSNYLLWRIRDSIKNSITLLSLEHYSVKQIENKNSDTKIQMLIDKNVNWNELNNHSKFGTFLYKNEEDGEIKEFEFNEKPNFELIYNLVKTYERK